MNESLQFWTPCNSYPSTTQIPRAKSSSLLRLAPLPRRPISVSESQERGWEGGSGNQPHTLGISQHLDQDSDISDTNEQQQTSKPDFAIFYLYYIVCTVIGARMSHWKWRETKLQPSRARSGHQISCCLVSLHFLSDILAPITVQNF